METFLLLKFYWLDVKEDKDERIREKTDILITEDESSNFVSKIEDEKSYSVMGHDINVYFRLT